MRKKDLFFRALSLVILGICTLTAFIIFKPDFFSLQKQRITNLATNLKNGNFGGENGGGLKGFIPEMGSVIKNNSGEIVNITLKNSPIYLPSDSLFINLVDAVPVSEITVGNTLYLNKLGPKFDTLLKKDTITLEVCRSSECSGKLILKMPNKIPTGSSLSQKQSLSGAITEVQHPFPVNISGTPPVKEEIPFTLTGYTLMGKADFRDSNSVKTSDGDVNGGYTGILDKQLGYYPTDGMLWFKNQDIWKRYSQKAYVFEVSGVGLNTRKDMYLLNFDGKSNGIRYTYFDKNNKQSRLFVNGKIHTFPNKFKDDSTYRIILEVDRENYILSIFDEGGEKLWFGVGKTPFREGDILYIGSRNNLDVWEGSIKSFSLYRK